MAVTHAFYGADAGGLASKLPLLILRCLLRKLIERREILLHVRREGAETSARWARRWQLAILIADSIHHFLLNLY